MMSYSSLARRVSGVRDPLKGSARRVWGVLFHTTGGGITPLAKKRGESPIDVAVKIYVNSQNGSNGYFWGGPTYVMDHDGQLHQLAPDEIYTNHCGGKHRDEYLSGAWIKKAHPAAVAQWHAHWGPRYKNPYQLFPSKSPNADYVGIEMIPCGDGFGEPMRPGLRFTQHQHDSAVEIAGDLGVRHHLPSGWHRTSRLLGHEDVDILNRMDKLGGWDPGWLREKPFFDFDYVRSKIA